MNLKVILLGIRDCGVYTMDEWEEYTDFLESGEEMKRLVYEHPHLETNELKERVCRGFGVGAANPDYSIWEKIVDENYFSDSSRRDENALGLISGCYDLLHLGHVRCIDYAAGFTRANSNGKKPVLCALILSDKDIRQKKGITRPIIDVNERMRLMAGIKMVDYVTPLSHPDCLASIEKIRPDYFFKYESDLKQGIVFREAELVKSLGGEVVFFPEHDNTAKRGFTSTYIIETIRNSKYSG